MEEKEVSADEYFFNLATFIAMSANLCVTEPPLYGPLRLVDALARLCDLPKYVADLKRDSFLEEVGSEIREKMFVIDRDPERFKQLLDSLASRFVREIKKRSA
jgi:hypothetical protein